MTTARINRSNARDTLAGMRDARNDSGTLRGRWHVLEDGTATHWVACNARIVVHRSGDTPRLSPRFTCELEAQLEEDVRRCGAVYVVYSYATPIAWTDGVTWTRPDVTYSPTTTRHAGMVPVDGTPVDGAAAMAGVEALDGRRRFAVRVARRVAAQGVAA